MSKIYDVAIVGAGAVGSAAAYQLSKLGKKVVVIEQSSPHDFIGSSGGESRICRLAIGEGRFYTPFALESYRICEEIERQTGFELLNITGGLIMVSASDDSTIHGRNNFMIETRKTAKFYQIKHYDPTPEEIGKIWPEFNLVGDEVSYYEHEAGFMIPESCIKAQLKLAERNGVILKFREKVLDVKPSYTAVCIKTDKRKYVAKKVILCAGPWISRFVPNYSHLFKVKRQVQYWFDIKDGKYPKFRLGNKFPVFIWQRNGRYTYGFPARNGSKGGLKVASESLDVVDPDSVDREVTKEETERMYEENIRDYFSDLSPRCIKSQVCMYTCTPDRHFVIDYHPDFDNKLIVASPCSGHGLKHSTAIGKILAEMSTVGKTSLDISHFRLDRFAAYSKNN